MWRVVASLIVSMLVLTGASSLAQAGGPPPPPGSTGPKLKDPEPIGDAPPGPSVGDASGTESEVGVSLSAEAFQLIDEGDEFFPGVFLRIDYDVLGVMIGGLVSGPSPRDSDFLLEGGGSEFGDDGLFYFGIDVLNSLGVELAQFGTSTVLTLLTPRFGMGVVLGEDTALIDIPVGLTGLRVTTCTPLCLRGDFRIPTFHVAFDPDDDFELAWASWGMAFEFGLVF